MCPREERRFITKFEGEAITEKRGRNAREECSSRAHDLVFSWY